MTQGITDRFRQSEARTQETKQLIWDIKRENARLKTLVAELDMIRAFSFCSLISNG
jgi:hypothetical protein